MRLKLSLIMLASVAAIGFAACDGDDTNGDGVGGSGGEDNATGGRRATGGTAGRSSTGGKANAGASATTGGAAGATTAVTGGAAGTAASGGSAGTNRGGSAGTAAMTGGAAGNVNVTGGVAGTVTVTGGSAGRAGGGGVIAAGTAGVSIGGAAGAGTGGAVTAGTAGSGGSAGNAGTAGTAGNATIMLSNAQVFHVLETFNTGEITEAQLAAQQAVDADVKAYAQKLLSEHTSARLQGRTLAAAESVTMVDNSVSQTLQAQSTAVVTQLHAAAASDFDKLYIGAQITMHQQALLVIDRTLLTSSQLPALDALISDLRIHVAAHLTEAQDILPTLP